MSHSTNSAPLLMSSRSLRSLFLHLQENYPSQLKQWLSTCPTELDPEKLQSEDLWIPHTWAYQLWQKASEITKDPLLGFKVGERFDLSRLDALGYACMSCRNLGEGYELTTRYYKLVETNVHLELDRNDEFFTLRFVENSKDPAPVQHNEYVAAAVFAGGCRAANARIPLTKVQLPHDNDQNKAALEKHFSCPVEFSCKEIAISFPNAVYEMPMANPDPAIKKMMEIELGRLLVHAPVSNPILGQIQALIAVNLTHPNLSLDWLSMQLGMSARTLDRRLRENGVTYSQLLDAVRSSVAQVHIAENRFSMSEIAFHLGFSELSVFTRTFKKWTGLSPSEYKQKKS